MNRSRKTVNSTDSSSDRDEDISSIALPLEGLDYEEFSNFPKNPEDLFLVNFDYSIKNIEEEDIWDVYGEQFWSNTIYF